MIDHSQFKLVPWGFAVTAAGHDLRFRKFNRWQFTAANDRTFVDVSFDKSAYNVDAWEVQTVTVKFVNLRGCMLAQASLSARSVRHRTASGDLDPVTVATSVLVALTGL